jgi:hypothetical protein
MRGLTAPGPEAIGCSSSWPTCRRTDPGDPALGQPGQRGAVLHAGERVLANPIEAQFGLVRTFVMGGPDHPSHTALSASSRITCADATPTPAITDSTHPAAAVLTGYADGRYLNHLSLLGTAEDLLGLSRLSPGRATRGCSRPSGCETPPEPSCTAGSRCQRGRRRRHNCRCSGHCHWLSTARRWWSACRPRRARGPGCSSPRCPPS